MLGRKQEINLVLQQIVDGLLLLLTFWGSFALRYYGRAWFGWDRAIGPFTDFEWMIPVIIPVLPIALEMQGFYNSSHQNTVKQIPLANGARRHLALSSSSPSASFSSRLLVPSRLVLIFFAVFSAIALLIRERLTSISFKNKLQKRPLPRKRDARLPAARHGPVPRTPSPLTSSSR